MHLAPSLPNADLPVVTYVGGPTVLLEWHGLRLLTDPTFDPAGTVYALPGYTLRKTPRPAVAASELGSVDAVLPSHEHQLAAPDGAILSVTATPARHGPAEGDRGPVIGFAINIAGETQSGVYFSGDTVYSGVGEIADRFGFAVALLCLGAARVSAAGDWPLTLTATDAVAVAAAGLSHRLRWPEPGKATVLAPDDCG